MVLRARIQGRRYFIVNGYIRLILGALFFLTGIILWIAQKNVVLLGLSLLGLVAVLSGWYMLRRGNNPNMKDVTV